MKTTNAEWWVYMLRCGDGSLYTGITTNVARRLAEHSGAAVGSAGKGTGKSAGKSKGAKSLRGKRPLAIARQFPCQNRSEASQLEYRIKQLSKPEKEALVAGQITVQELAGVEQ